MAMSSVPEAAQARRVDRRTRSSMSKTFKPFVNNKKVAPRTASGTPRTSRTFPTSTSPRAPRKTRGQQLEQEDDHDRPLVQARARRVPRVLCVPRARSACCACSSRLWTQMAVSPTLLYLAARRLASIASNNQTGYVKMCGAPGTERRAESVARPARDRWTSDARLDLPHRPAHPGHLRGGDDGPRAARRTTSTSAAAANAWERRDKGAEPGEQGVAFHYQMCRIRARRRCTPTTATANSTTRRTTSTSENSKSYIVAAARDESCKRWKHVVVGDIARAWHDGLMEAVNCIGNDVACHKEPRRECLGAAAAAQGPTSSTTSTRRFRSLTWARSSSARRGFRRRRPTAQSRRPWWTSRCLRRETVSVSLLR